MESYIIVVSSADGRKYKMVMKGDVGTVPIVKIKRYLHQATGVSPAHQRLSFEGRDLPDGLFGSDVGLHDGAVLFLDVATTSASPTEESAAPSAPKTDDLSRQRLRKELDAARARETQMDAANERLERILRDQQRQIDELKKAITGRDIGGSKTALLTAPSSTKTSVNRDDEGGAALSNRGESTVLRLHRSLERLTAELHLDAVPQLDSNNTCVIAVPHTSPDFTILLTFDPASDRLYMYTTLLSELPLDVSRRLRLYEVLLEGALLGRDMAGGGVGLSVKNELVLLSVSIDLRHSDERCLGALCAPFVAAATKWTSVCRDLVNDRVS